MKYGKIDFVEKPVSRLILGTAVPYIQWGNDCDELFDAAYAAGITTFDTARCYMRSESILGKWLEKRNLYDKVVIQTKGALDGFFGNKRVNEKCIRRDLQSSAAALRTNFIDIYLLHRDDEKKDVGEIVEVMNTLVAEGKIGAFGGSNWTHTRLEEANEYAYKHNLQPFSLSQPHFGLAEAVKMPWAGCLSVTGKNNGESRAWYARTGFALTAYSPLGRGVFSGKFKSDDIRLAKKVLDGAAKTGFLYPENIERLRRTEKIAAETGYTVAQLALAWTLLQDMNVFVIVGSSRAASVKQNLTALDISLTDGQLAYMNLQADNY